MFAVFENLQVFESRYEELNLKLYDPATAADRELYARLMKEHKEIEPIVETYRAWRQCGEDLSGAKELLEEAADRELKEMAQQEIREKGIELSRLEEELKLLLLPKDPNDGKNVIVEIRGGAGGEEAALFAYNLYRMYTAYAEGKGWKTEIVSLNETELGGFKEVSFLIDGEGAYSRLKYESGVHRVQRVPETEAQGRIHTSTATVAVLPEAEEVDVDIDPKAVDVAYENAALNGIGKDRYTVRAGDILTDRKLEAELGGEKYPLVLANIVADVIIPLSAWVPQVLSQDGVFLCSGIIAPRAQEVADALARNGLKVTKKREKNGWAALEAVLA